MTHWLRAAEWTHSGEGGRDRGKKFHVYSPQEAGPRNEGSAQHTLRYLGRTHTLSLSLLAHPPGDWKGSGTSSTYLALVARKTHQLTRKRT